MKFYLRCTYFENNNYLLSKKNTITPVGLCLYFIFNLNCENNRFFVFFLLGHLISTWVDDERIRFKATGVHNNNNIAYSEIDKQTLWTGVHSWIFKYIKPAWFLVSRYFKPQTRFEFVHESKQTAKSVWGFR